MGELFGNAVAAGFLIGLVLYVIHLLSNGGDKGWK